MLAGLCLLSFPPYKNINSHIEEIAIIAEFFPMLFFFYNTVVN